MRIKHELTFTLELPEHNFKALLILLGNMTHKSKEEVFKQFCVTDDEVSCQCIAVGTVLNIMEDEIFKIESSLKF